MLHSHTSQKSQSLSWQHGSESHHFKTAWDFVCSRTKFSTEKTTVIFMGFPLYMTCACLLKNLNFPMPLLHSIYLMFNYDKLWGVSFLVLVSVVFCVHLVSVWMSFLDVRKFSMIFLEVLFMLLTWDSSPYMPIIHRFLSFLGIPKLLHISSFF